jgi:uncharacterized protein
MLLQEAIYVNKLKHLVKTIATSLPFQPNITKLAHALDITRNTTMLYLQYLQQADIINMLTAADKSYATLTKPEKIYLQNTNICYALGQNNIAKGTMRELFFMNQIKTLHTINSSAQGDFLIDEKFIFEVGEPNKKFAQIAKLPNSFVASTDREIGIGNKIPLWLFGFLY